MESGASFGSLSGYICGAIGGFASGTGGALFDCTGSDRELFCCLSIASLPCAGIGEGAVGCCSFCKGSAGAVVNVRLFVPAAFFGCGFAAGATRDAEDC